MLVVASGVALAVCAALALLVQPSVKAEQHRACKAQWRLLRGQATKLVDDELLLAVTQVQASGPSGIAALADPAYNATLIAAGQHSATIPLGWWQWCWKMIA